MVVLCLPDPCSTEGTYTYDPDLVVLFANDLADPAAPTESEIAAATDLTEEYNLHDSNGWEVQSGIITDPSWGVFDSQRPGRLSIDTATMLFPADRLGNDIRQIMQRHTTGWIIIAPAGLTGLVNVYPVRVASVTHRLELRTGLGAQIRVIFSVITEPVIDAVIVP